MLRTRIVRLLYRHRARLKRFIPVRRPICVQLRGFKLFVRLDDWAVGARIAIRRTYEPHVTAALRPLLQPGMVVVDIGANIGYYTMLAATQVGQHGRVHAFEPSAENCALLYRSIQANHLNNVYLLPNAIGDTTGMIYYGQDDSNGRISSERSDPDLLEVPIITLDEALAGAPRIDLIKIDIEGAEGRALRGMQQVLAHYHPTIICEFSPRILPNVSDMQPHELLELLRGHGYQIAVIARIGPLLANQTNQQIMALFHGPGTIDHIDLLATVAKPDHAQSA